MVTLDRLKTWEPWIVWCIGAIVFSAVPILLGSLGMSWDALNHHIYLGWVAEHPRFELDFAASAYQAYQFPYLYWPVYRLAVGGATGVVAGIVLALLQSTAIPAVWVVARACCPGYGWQDVTFRIAGVALAFLGGLSLSLLDATSNDLLAAIPLLWAVALIFLAIDACEREPGAALPWVAWSGVCSGTAVAFKLSNGPLALVLPLAWILVCRGKGALTRVVIGGLASIAAFVLVYGYWGYELWLHYGNPLYPFYDSLFAPLRDALGWHP